jgi:hypothetical protein
VIFLEILPPEVTSTPIVIQGMSPNFLYCRMTEKEDSFTAALKVQAAVAVLAVIALITGSVAEGIAARVLKDCIAPLAGLPKQSSLSTLALNSIVLSGSTDI